MTLETVIPENPGPTLTKQQFDKLLQDLGSNNGAKRLAAQDSLLAMGPEGFERLLVRMQGAKRESRRRLTVGIVGIFFLLFGNDIAKKLFHIDIGGYMGGLCSGFGGFVVFNRSTNAGARILAKFEDVRVVGPLVDALSYRDQDTQIAARLALLRLLPRMRASDAHLLNEAQRKKLNALLTDTDRAMTLAILKAWEQVGDESALPFVESLTSASITKEDWKIEQAARECLPFLKARVEQLRVSRSLLRASSAESATPETLLRPASAATHNDAPKILLRSVE